MTDSDEMARLRFGGPGEQWSRGWTRADFIYEIELLREELRATATAQTRESTSMKTDNGWIRGTLCGKPQPAGRSVSFVCAWCGRCSENKAELCFPVRGS